jgi:hypothetical protein
LIRWGHPIMIQWCLIERTCIIFFHLPEHNC